MTNRLREALLALGLATSVQVSERLVSSLSMQVSAPTLLRHLSRVACLQYEPDYLYVSRSSTLDEK